MKNIRKNCNKYKIIDIAKILGVNDYRNFDEIFDKLQKCNDLVSDITIYGTTIETIFEHTIASISKCKLIKKEDDGNIYSQEDLKVPDFKIVTSEGKLLFVEVKDFNDNSRVISFTKKYVDSLLRYTALFNSELKIAIYWNKYNLWSLNSISDFKECDSKYSIDFESALKKSEMVELGDLTIGLKPKLVLKEIYERNSNIELKVKSLNFVDSIVNHSVFYNEKEVVDKNIKAILFFFMIFGCWTFEEKVEEIDEHSFSVDFIFKPQITENNFSIIGSLSSILTRFYKFICYGPERKSINLSPNVVDIDLDFIFNYSSNKDIPMWIFKTVPNKNN